MDEGLAQFGVRLARVGEVTAHDGQFGGAVGGQRPLPFRCGELPRSGGQLRWVIEAAGQQFGPGRHLRAVAGRVAGDDRERIRRHLLSLFTIAGPDDPAVNAARRALASALF